MQTYQQAQLLSTSQFIVQLPQILGKLHQLQSPFAAQAQKLVDDNATFTPALHTLFLQRWRLSLVVQATSLNQQLLDEERDQLLSEVQERMTLSGQLDPVLAEDALSRTRVDRLLRGYRDRPPAARESVCDVMIRLSQLIADVNEIAELDINPLMVSDRDGEPIAVDARIAIDTEAVLKL